MKFSILIPSKNGEKDIENCLKSVLDQSYNNFEIIVGDNNNSKEFKKILLKYKKYKNIKIITHKIDLPVTESWQSCLDASSGDYIIMLGDDDCLLKDSLKIIYDVIKNNNFPECLSFNGIAFFNKGSLIDIKKTAYSKLYFDYEKNKIYEGMLSKKKRFNIVKSMFEFNNRMPLNMQPHIVSRNAIRRLNKDLYQPPFPDHYALNSLLLTADTWLVSYKKIVALGITDNSFGHFYFNSKTADGIKYLGHKMNFPDSISGSILNTCMMMWLMNIKNDYSSILKNVKVSREAYAQRQFYFFLSQYIKKKISFELVIKFLINLNLKDKLRILKIFFRLDLIYRGAKRLFSEDISNMIYLNQDINIYNFTRKNIF